MKNVITHVNTCPKEPIQEDVPTVVQNQNLIVQNGHGQFVKLIYNSVRQKILSKTTTKSKYIWSVIKIFV